MSKKKDEVTEIEEEDDGEEETFSLGDRVRDKVTGLSGIITEVTFRLGDSSPSICLESSDTDESGQIVRRWFSPGRLEIEPEGPLGFADMLRFRTTAKEG